MNRMENQLRALHDDIKQLGPDDFGYGSQKPSEEWARKHTAKEISVNVHDLEQRLNDPLREIAIRTKALTYGEMMDYVVALMGAEYKAPQNADEFAALLFKWTKIYD